MLEQQLINAFMKFTSRAGGGNFIRELIQRVEDNGNPKSWTPAEMQKAIGYLEDKINIFSKEDAITVINSLVKKYGIDPDEIQPGGSDIPDQDELTGVQGLQ